MGNTVDLISSKDISKHLSQDPKVQEALRSHGKNIARAGKALLASHRDTGAHKVEYEGHVSSREFGHIDHYVALTGPAAVSVEFGHRTKNGTWVNGLYIMTRVMLTR